MHERDGGAHGTRPGDRQGHTTPARPAAAGGHLVRRARVQRDDDRAAPLLESCARPAHDRLGPPHRERADGSDARRRHVGDLVRGAARPFGVDPGPEALAYIRREGGIPKSRLFTKCFLALLGQWPWQRMVPIPPELVLLPPWAPFSIYNFSCWARQTFVALAVAQSLRPVRPTDVDLSAIGAIPGKTRPAAPPNALRRKALRGAEQWIRERQEADGSW